MAVCRTRGFLFLSIFLVQMYLLLGALLPFVSAIPLRETEGSAISPSLGETFVRKWRSSLVRDRETLPDYQPLCQTVSHRVDLDEANYEFRPPFYHSIECKHLSNGYHASSSSGRHDTSQICLQSGLSCVQRTKTIQIARRKIGTTCWSLFTKEVPSGCECMWPVQSHGNSKHHL